MLASGWQIGKLMNLFDISDLAVWEHEMFEAQFWRDVFFFFFSPLLFGPQKSLALGLFYWAVSRHGQTRVAISIPEAPAVQGRWPSPSQSSLPAGWEAAGGWRGARGFGQELAPGWVIAFDIGEMGAILVKEAGCKGL